MTVHPFMYFCSHAGKFGNIRWLNSDTRYPDWVNKRWFGWTMRRGHWGRCAFFAPATAELEGRS